MEAPEQIDGFRHDRPEANQGQGCFCGCARSEGRRGSLVRDGDTEALSELGMAVYEFPADRHPTADYERLVLRVCFHLHELKQKAPAP